MNRLTVDGVSLEIRHIPGPVQAARAPLVFLHEGVGSVTMWRDWPDRLCAQSARSGIVYSRRGYGASDAVPDVRGAGRLAPDYMHREAFEVLPRLLDELAIERPVLVGHSDGGSIALLHASRFPLSACIVMAPHVMVEECSIRSIEEARERYASGLRERLARFHADVDGAFWQWNDVWLSAGFRSFDIRPDCRRIACPVLALQGEDDVYGTMAQIEQISPTQGRFEIARIADCGHTPHRDQPERVTARIAGFLSTVD